MIILDRLMNFMLLKMKKNIFIENSLNIKIWTSLNKPLQFIIKQNYLILTHNINLNMNAILIKKESKSLGKCKKKTKDLKQFLRNFDKSVYINNQTCYSNCDQLISYNLDQKQKRKNNCQSQQIIRIKSIFIDDNRYVKINQIEDIENFG
ncbi:unnamed protein product [Paramecium primaurelia]|uniref:Uncharacterized protein n=1 Tax=Paramecium primaurelia TaxID=5886 RepID=A0A8S1KBM5_PARPR|nr:unnamed protein product [Paramecium primaurelia]CAD8050306.1 unnamed protein product [Paramecium primaurelia]